MLATSISWAGSPRNWGAPGLHFTEETLKLLEAYSFTGNVRQLQNIVERAATLSDTEELGPDSLPPGVRGTSEDTRHLC